MMRATPHLRTFAGRLIAHEANEHHGSATEPKAIFPVFERLRPRLAMLMGNGGSRALQSRALALAHGEVRWLRAVHVKADGTLEGLEELHAKITPETFLEGRTVFLAQLLGLLAAFIGITLTLELVRETWPKIKLDDLNFD